MPKQIEPKEDNISDIAERGHMSIVGVLREDGSFSAYQSKDYHDFHMILAFGEVLPRNIAAFLFPELAQKSREYRAK